MTNVGKTYLALGIAQALHSMEEMLMHLYSFFRTATGSFQELPPVLPRLSMKAEVFAVLNMAVITIILASVPFVESNRRWAVLLAWCWAVVEVLNGLAHLGVAVAFSRYVPGALTAPLLVVAGSTLFVRLCRQRHTQSS